MYCTVKIEIKFHVSNFSKLFGVSNGSQVTSVLELFVTLLSFVTRGSILRLLKSKRITFGFAVPVGQPAAPSQPLFFLFCFVFVWDNKSFWPLFHSASVCDDLMFIVYNSLVVLRNNLFRTLNLVTKRGHSRSVSDPWFFLGGGGQPP